MLWHSGSTPDSHAELFYLPESDWGGVILTNKNHVLEEDGLYYVKTGIINILNGKEPVEIPDNTPIIQFITLLFIGLLFGMLIYLVRKTKSKKHLRKGFWRIVGISLLCLSVGRFQRLSMVQGPHGRQ